MDNVIAFPASRRARKTRKTAAAPPMPHAPPPVPELANGAVPCRDWCTAGDGHRDELYLDDQTCRSVPYRLDATEAGGHPGHTRATAVDRTTTEGTGEIGCPPAAGHTTVVLQYQQAPGQQASIVLGIEVAGAEQWAILTVPEARALAGNLDLAITNAAGVRPRDIG